MARFTKKPVEVEAITFDELVEHRKENSGNAIEDMPWSFEYKGHHITHENDECCLIPTEEGTMKFTPSDMLITGVQGEIYPCKIDIFEKTYTSADRPFNPGDWIIATRPMMVESFGGWTVLGSSMKPDRAYMHKPIKVSAVTDHHIVYEFKGFVSDTVRKNIIPMDEVIERGFVIADQVLVDAAGKD